MSNCKLQPLYFATTKFEILDEFEGEKGTFIKSFLINDKTNLNDWEVTKKANQTDGPEFVGQPGIEFWNAGRRDHTVGSTYTEAKNMQTPHTKAIIRKVLGAEKGEKLSQISKIIDEELATKLRNKEIQYVSPAIFPRTIDDVEIIEKPDGSHIHRVHRYYPLHYAFVDEPAYGEDAKISDVCEGPNCMIKLSQESAKSNLQIVQVATCSKTGKKSYTVPDFTAAQNENVSKCISGKTPEGQTANPQDIAICINEFKSKKANNSQIQQIKNDSVKMPDEDLQKKNDELTSKVADLEKEKEESAKKLKKALKQNSANDPLHEPNHEEIMKSSLKKAMEEEDEEKRAGLIKKAMEEFEDHKKENAKKANETDKTKEEEHTAALKLAKKPLIVEYIAARRVAGDSEEELVTKTAALEKETILQLQAKLEIVRPFMAQINFNHQASSPNPDVKFPMMGDAGQLSGAKSKTAEETYSEVYG